MAMKLKLKAQWQLARANLLLHTLRTDHVTAPSPPVG